MASIFSDHFNSSGTVGPGEGALTEELALDTGRKIEVGLGGARLRYKKGKVTCGTIAGIGDEIRMVQMRSSDRIHSILFSSDGGSTAGDADLGLYKVGSIDHDGAVIDDDLWSTTAEATDTAHDRVEVFEGGALDTEDVGKALWQLADVGGGTYSVDPFEDWDIVFTVTAAFTVAVSTLQIEVFYTAGD